jgi:hypothetical protein
MAAAAKTPSTLEEALQPAFDEIARRRDVKATNSDETIYFPRSGTLSLPFVLPEQNYALVTFGTAVLAPRPLDPIHPALRVYGVFPTREEAAEHADIVAALDPECSRLVVQTRTWVLLPQTERCRDDAEANACRTAALLQEHRARQMGEGETYKTRVRERDGGPAPSAMEAHDEAEDGTEEAEALVYRPPRRLRGGAEVRGQSAVVLAVVPNRATGECLVQVLGCHETCDDADAWSRDVATRHVTDDDVVVARTCEWLYPNGDVKTATKTHYRHDELQRIMDTAARNPQVVRDYKAWKAERDGEAP